MDEDYSDLLAIRKEGDVNALSRLIARYKESVFRYVYRIVLNESDAAEITEDVFVKVFFNAEKYKVKAKVKTWIFTIATNASKDHLRRNRKRFRDVSIHETFGDSLEMVDSLQAKDVDAAESAEKKEERENLLNAIAKLPEQYRIPFIFCKLENHSHHECAEMLHTTSKVVEMRIYRAKKKLVSALTKQFPTTT